MAKKYKKKKNKSGFKNHKPIKKFPVKRALILLGCVVLSFAVYYTFIALNVAEILPVYTVLAAALFVIYFAYNRGMMSVPERESLSDDMSESEKDEFLNGIKDRRQKSRPILYVFLSLALTILCDLMYLFAVLKLGIDL